MWGWFSGGVLNMLRLSEHADSSWERAPRCEEAIGARHMTLRHHWRLQLTPEGLASWHNQANNLINLCSILVILTFIESSFQALWFLPIGILLTCLILEIGPEGHKKSWTVENAQFGELYTVLFSDLSNSHCGVRNKLERHAQIAHKTYSAHGGLTLSCRCLPYTPYNVPNVG